MGRVNEFEGERDEVSYLRWKRLTRSQTLLFSNALAWCEWILYLVLEMRRKDGTGHRARSLRADDTPKTVQNPAIRVLSTHILVRKYRLP